MLVFALILLLDNCSASTDLDASLIEEIPKDNTTDKSNIEKDKNTSNGEKEKDILKIETKPQEFEMQYKTEKSWLPRQGN